MRYLALSLVLFSLATNAQAQQELPQIVPETEGEVLEPLQPQIDPNQGVPVAPTAPIDDAYSPYSHMLQQNATSSSETVSPDVTTTSPTPEAPVVDPATAAAEVEVTPAEPEAPKMIDSQKAKLQVLDKLDAKVAEIEIEIGKKTKYNELEIELKRCVQSPKDSKEENIAFLRVWDLGKGDYSNEVFKGWMFSSNPALHTLEHPIYDLTLLNCFDDEKSDKKDEKAEADKK